MTVTADIGTGQLAELVKQVQAGNEVVLTQGDKPVAKLVPTDDRGVPKDTVLQIRSLQGHEVLKPVVSQNELAGEMFERQALPLPDYAERRRRIFGDRIFPNMVLDSRAEESW